MQILDHVSDICYELGLKAGAVFGGEDRQSQAMKLRRGVDVLVGTPGRLMDFMGSRKIPSDRIAYLTLDEADRILEIGFE
jgi:superfamily II DNA/RNA helicase